LSEHVSGVFSIVCVWSLLSHWFKLLSDRMHVQLELLLPVM